MDPRRWHLPTLGTLHYCCPAAAAAAALSCVQVGSVNNTFGVPGVSDHCHFLKSLQDAHQLRTRITDCFERAALPNVRDQGGCC
jgi:hypothetical protein